jgi:hypothetical protein
MTPGKLRNERRLREAHGRLTRRTCAASTSGLTRSGIRDVLHWYTLGRPKQIFSGPDGRKSESEMPCFRACITSGAPFDMRNLVRSGSGHPLMLPEHLHFLSCGEIGHA